MIVRRAHTTLVCVCSLVRKSSYGPMAFSNSGFHYLMGYVIFERIPRSLRKHLIPNACILLSMSAVMVHVSHAYKNMDMARERIRMFRYCLMRGVGIGSRLQHFEAVFKISRRTATSVTGSKSQNSESVCPIVCLSVCVPRPVHSIFSAGVVSVQAVRTQTAISGKCV